MVYQLAEQDADAKAVVALLRDEIRAQRVELAAIAGQLQQAIRKHMPDLGPVVEALLAGEDTILQFQKIADAGRGVCEPIDNRDRVLQRVLTLAFGSQYSQDLRRVVQSIEQDRTRADVASLHLVRKGGQPLIDALKQRPVSTLLWNALVRRPRQHVAQSLLDLLDDSRTPTHTRHACAAAIQRILKLAVPPIDPGSNAPPSKQYVARLRSLVKQLPE